jgi:hypothetical protein
MDELDKLRKKLRKELDIEVDEDSDHPVHEKFTKEKKMRK